MPAWRVSLVPDLEHLAQLPEGEPDCLTGTDKRKPVNHSRVVVPISGIGPLRWGDETPVLVEPDRRSGQPDSSRDLTNLHKPKSYHLTFNCT